MGHRRIQLDPVFDALSPLGRYQVLQALVFYISCTSCACSLLMIVFTGQKVGHSCAPPPNDTTLFVASGVDPWTNGSEVHHGKCSIDVTSNISGVVSQTERSCAYGMSYDKPRDFSVQSEFDLVCERAPLLGLSQTLLMLGQGIGAVFFTALSDRYGRKRIQIITNTLLTGCSVVLSFAPEYVTFAVFKLFTGALQQGTMLTASTALVESFPSRYRSHVGGLFAGLAWAVGNITFVMLAYFLRDYSWRVLQLASASVGAVVLLQIVILKEPMRWLLAKGRTDEVEQQLETAAKVNKRDVHTVLDLFRKLEGIAEKDTDDAIKTYNADITKLDGDDFKESAGEPASMNDVSDGGHAGESNQRGASLIATGTELRESSAENLSWSHLFCHSKLRLNSVCLWLVWFINSATYFALYLLSGSFTGDLYLSFFLNVIVEVPACFILFVTVDRIGRRGTMIMFHSVAAVSLLASSVFISFKEHSGMTTAAMVTSLIGKLGITGSFDCIFFFTPEIFPTKIRNLAYGTASTGARLGGMISAFVGILADHVVWAPGAVFGACNLLVIFLIHLLPDSMDRELPQTLRDLEAWYDPDDDKDTKDVDKDKDSERNTLV